MSIPLIVSEAAESDLHEAFDWYESQLSGLGDRLLTHVQKSLDSISENPSMFPRIHRETRRALVHRFPFAIYFIIDPEIIDVVAVLHTKRHPRQWQARGR